MILQEKIHINKVNSGDTIIHEGVLSTVTSTNIGWSNFMGRTLFGDSYRLGRKLVTRVTFKNYGRDKHRDEHTSRNNK